MKNKIYGRKVGTMATMALLIESDGVSTGGVKVDQDKLEACAMSNVRRAVQALRSRQIEGYVVFEGDPTHYAFTPEADFVYPAQARATDAIPTAQEGAANDAVKDALKALQRARELCERAGYGMLVLEPLADAHHATQYALESALGRT